MQIIHKFFPHRDNTLSSFSTLLEFVYGEKEIMIVIKFHPGKIKHYKITLISVKKCLTLLLNIIGLQGFGQTETNEVTFHACAIMKITSEVYLTTPNY